MKDVYSCRHQPLFSSHHAHREDDPWNDEGRQTVTRGVVHWAEPTMIAPLGMQTAGLRFERASAGDSLRARVAMGVSLRSLSSTHGCSLWTLVLGVAALTCAHDAAAVKWPVWNGWISCRCGNPNGGVTRRRCFVTFLAGRVLIWVGSVVCFCWHVRVCDPTSPQNLIPPSSQLADTGSHRETRESTISQIRKARETRDMRHATSDTGHEKRVDTGFNMLDSILESEEKKA